MPTIKYNSGINIDKECGICLAEYVHGDLLKILVCLHKFHTYCVDNWLKYNLSCPVCKWNLTKTNYKHHYKEVE